MQSNLNYRGTMSKFVKGQQAHNKTSAEVEKQIIELGLTDLSEVAITNLVPVSRSVVRRVLKSNDLGRKHISASHSVNHDYFSSVTTEAQAYWLGFLAADGCVTGKNANVVSLLLSNKDLAHVELFKSTVSSTHTISSNSRDCSGIKFHSDKMAKDLAKYNIVKRKTYTYEWPTNLSSTLARHFIRGVFDGDGSISGNFFLCGTESLLLTIRALFAESCATNPNISVFKRQGTFGLAYSGRLQLQRLRDYLYSDATVFLKRKKDKFDLF